LQANLVQEYDQEERKKDMDALEKKKQAAEAAGVKVTITRCIVVKAYESNGTGEMTVAVGGAVMLPTLDQFDSPHSPGQKFYKGVHAGAVGLMPVDCLEESAARATAVAAAAAEGSAPTASTLGRTDTAELEEDEAADEGGGEATVPGVLEQMADKLFDMLKGMVDGDGCLGGKALQPVMSKCDPAVPGAMLGKIWSACDSNKTGKLNKSQVVKMLGFIGQVQSGATPNPNDYLAAPPPKIAGLPIPAGGAAAVAKAAPTGPTLAESTTKLFGMFKVADDGVLSGAQLQPVMSKCEPPIDKAMLGKIWTVCDEAKSGKLTKAQVMKMLGLMGQAQASQHHPLPEIHCHLTSSIAFCQYHPEPSSGGGGDCGGCGGGGDGGGDGGGGMVMMMVVLMGADSEFDVTEVSTLKLKLANAK
jgi:Ca2+-binding EF-hand superfamily protein